MNIKVSWIIAGAFIIGIFFIVQCFRPLVVKENVKYRTVIVVCDSVFTSINNDVIFAVRNKADEHFYIAGGSTLGLDVMAINNQCKSKVLALEFEQSWSLLDINGNIHNLTNVKCDDELIWSNSKVNQAKNISLQNGITEN